MEIADSGTEGKSDASFRAHLGDKSLGVNTVIRDLASARAAVVGLDVSGIDPSFKAHAQRGIGRYVRELIRYFEGPSFQEIVRDFEVATFSHSSLREKGSAVLRGAAAMIERAPVLKATLRQQVLYPYQLASALGTVVGSQAPRALDVVHFPAHMDAPSWGLSRYAITVLDLIPLVCADLYKASQAGLRFKFARWLELSAIRNASVVLCISAHTARDVHRILGVPWDRLVITPLGVNPSSFSEDSSDSAHDPASVRTLKERISITPDDQDRPIVLYVGGIDPRKNISFLVKSFSEVRKAWAEEKHGRPPLLVMAGNIQGEKEFPRLQATISELGMSADVVLSGFVGDKDLRALYRESAVFFFPSLYEGFGLPPLEAMAAGLPVASSDTSAMPEVLGEAALLFSPTDERQAIKSLTEILTRSELAARLKAEGRERAKLFTWEKTGEATVHAYQRLVDQGLAHHKKGALRQ